MANKKQNKPIRHSKAADRIIRQAIPGETESLPEGPSPTYKYRKSGNRPKMPPAQSGRKGRPRRSPQFIQPSGSATKCIYFRDSSQVAELEGIADAHSRASVSSIIQQLTDMFLKAYAKKQSDDNVVMIPVTKVFL